MCGRYTLRQTTKDLVARFGIELVLFETVPRYNIAPSQTVAVIRGNGERRLEGLRWGLVPFWAEDLKKTRPMINARMETLATKPTFKTCLTRRRCLIPSDGFFEWKSENDARVPLHITMKDKRLFAFAGLWDTWKSAAGEVLETCTIITVAANGWIAAVHERMPAILCREDEDRWLDASITGVPDILSLLRPYPAEQMEATPVSRAVNSSQVDSPECVAPRQ